MADSEDDQSKTRSKWAEDGIVLADERAFFSWMRAGLGAIRVAIGLKIVFGATEPTSVAMPVASLFNLAAIVIFRPAQRQACRTMSRLQSNDAEAQSPKNFTRLATIKTIVALAT